MNHTHAPAWRARLLGLAVCLPAVASAQHLDLPPRPTDAQTGTEFIRTLQTLTPAEREERVAREILKGNVPEWLRSLHRVRIASGPHTLEVWTTPDYLAIGSESDAVRIPMRPQTAHRIAEALAMTLPTPRLVDSIWADADRRLEPSPIPPSDAMTTPAVFLLHSRTVDAQRGGDTGGLLAGHKKDVVLSQRLASDSGRVAIYGWHRLSGEPIQPLYLGHTADWVDYSHGVRLVSRLVHLNGEPMDIWDVLSDPDLAPLLSHEGTLQPPWFARER